MAVEVQALCSRSYLSIPRRVALGFDANRLNLLLAVLEKRLKLNLSQTDIYAKVGGGIRLADPGLDLGLVTAVLSSFYDIALPPKAIFFGEMDLNGQIRPVACQDMRLRQATRLGFTPIVGPGSVTTIVDLAARLFAREANTRPAQARTVAAQGQQPQRQWQGQGSRAPQAPYRQQGQGQASHKTEAQGMQRPQATRGNQS